MRGTFGKLIGEGAKKKSISRVRTPAMVGIFICPADRFFCSPMAETFDYFPSQPTMHILENCCKNTFCLEASYAWPIANGNISFTKFCPIPFNLAVGGFSKYSCIVCIFPSPNQILCVCVNFIKSLETQVSFFGKLKTRGIESLQSNYSAFL